MKKAAALFVVLAPLVGFALAQPSGQQNKTDSTAAQQMPEGMPPMPPPPGEHHKWLDQLVGSWTFESEMSMGEGQPPVTSRGTDTVRSLEGRWVLCELLNEVPGMGSMRAVLTLGFNPETGKYQGTWIDSVTDHLWVYVGTLDPTRKILVLEATGPNMMDPSKGDTQYRDVIEFKSADHRTLTSSAMVDGEWIQFMTAHYRRVK